MSNFLRSYIVLSNWYSPRSERFFFVRKKNQFGSYLGSSHQKKTFKKTEVYYSSKHRSIFNCIFINQKIAFCFFHIGLVIFCCFASPFEQAQTWLQFWRNFFLALQKSFFMFFWTLLAISFMTRTILLFFSFFWFFFPSIAGPFCVRFFGHFWSYPS